MPARTQMKPQRCCDAKWEEQTHKVVLSWLPFGCCDKHYGQGSSQKGCSGLMVPESVAIMASKCDSGADMAIGAGSWVLRFHTLSHKQEAERKNSKWYKSLSSHSPPPVTLFHRKATSHSPPQIEPWTGAKHLNIWDCGWHLSFKPQYMCTLCFHKHDIFVRGNPIGAQCRLVAV